MGFFFGEETSTKKTSSKVPLNTAKELECKVCPREKIRSNYHPKMKPIGSLEPVIYILKSQVEAEEDMNGKYFTSAGGEFLLSHFSSTWNESIRTNAVLRCAGLKAPTELEYTCCRASIEKDIVTCKPDVILVVGEEALKWLLNEGGIQKWRGRYIPIQIQNHECLAFPILDPAFVLSKRRPNYQTKEKTLKTEYDGILTQDLETLKSDILNNTLPNIYVHKDDPLKNIEWVDGAKGTSDLNIVLKWLGEATDWGPHALDIETTHLRPYEENAKILTIAIGTFDKTLAFPVHYPGVWSPPQLEKLEKALVKYLINSDLKICHNTKFELEWLSFFYGNEILHRTKFDDTMALAYTLDERRGMLSLDTQVLLYFGFYLKELSKIDRSKMLSYSVSKILPYNGLDTKWTFALWEKLIVQVQKDPKLTKVHAGLLRAVPTLTGAQKVGICVNYELRDQFEKDLTQKTQTYLQKIKQLPEVQKYERTLGPFNPDSPNHLMKLLKDIYGLDDELRTKDGSGYSTGEPILKALKEVAVAPLILKYRAVAKKMSTYVTPLIELCYHYDGRLHTNFNLYETSTGRLSSNGPNVQNFPSRKGKEIRRLIIAPENHWIVSSDYGQIEARILGVASQDPVFCEALWNDYDVHKEWAERIAHAYPKVIGGSQYLQDKEKMDTFRKDVKNQWVFPAFYGSSPNSISKGVGVPIEITKELFKEFWNDFKEIKKWQKWVLNFYEKHGYVQTLTGRRRHGPLGYNEAINGPIQGTASDLCVNAMSHLADAGYQIIMNVHDDITSYIHDDDLETSIDEIAKIMCDTPYELIPNMNVPISVEISVGSNWCDQEKLEVFKSTDFMHVDKKLKRIEDYV